MNTRNISHNSGKGDSDWAADLADTIERLVTTFRTNTTDRLERGARILVYGLAAALLGIAVVTLLIITAVRFLDIWIPGSVWSAYLVLGGMFSLVGLLCWKLRFSPVSS